MKKTELSLVYFVAKLSPWIAPIPSAFFIARSCTRHLDLPWSMSFIIGLVVESLGLTSIYTWLMLQNWNNTKRKIDPIAPVSYAFALVMVYVLTTITLTVILEISPNLAIFTPALFPVLAVIGGCNLVLFSRQEMLEKTVHFERQEAHLERQKKCQKKLSENISILPKQVSNLEKNDNSLALANKSRKEKRTHTLTTILDILRDEPNIGVTGLSRKIQHSRQSVYNYLAELEQNGDIHKNGDGFVIKDY